MKPIAIASLSIQGSESLMAEADKLIAESKLPQGVEREKKRLRSNNPQELFECVNALTDRIYRNGRQADLGGRGQMSLQVGIALDEDRADALERAVTLCARAPSHVIVAEEAFVRALDPLRCINLDLSNPKTLEDRTVYETFPPGQRDCFVVMPMGSANGDTRAQSKRVLESLIRPACRELNLRPVAPTSQTGEKISVDVFGALHLSSLVVAYLGGRPWNANVMVEVGYRVALGRPLVLLADEEPPIDLGDRRAVLLREEWWNQPQDWVNMLVAEMRDRLANAVDGDDLYPIAEIEVDESPVPEERRRHRVVHASETTANLFGLPREVLVGMSPADLIAHLGELVGEPAQFGAFQEEQGDLYAQLGSQSPFPGGNRQTNVTATVPLTFFSHPDRTFNGRAFLPCVISQSRRAGLSSTQRVVYVEVTDAVRCRQFRSHGEVRMCDLKNGNCTLAFELYAKSYDEILGRLTNYQEVRDRHVGKILEHCNGRASGAKVLDVGAGTGNVTVPLLEHGLQVSAIDLNQAMLQRLMEKVPSVATERLRVQRRDCRSLRVFKDNSFDAVTMSLVLFAMGACDVAREALAEAVRVLKPGGLIVVTEPTRIFRLEPLIQQAEEELRAQEDWPKLQHHWDAVVQANSIINPENNEFLAAQDIQDALLNDFEDLEIRGAYRGYCSTITGRKIQRVQ